MAKSSAKKAADERRQKSRKIVDEKREKNRAKNGSLRNISADLKGATFVILKNHASAPVKTEGLSPTSKGWNPAGNKFTEKSEMPKSKKTIVARIVREPDLGLFNHPKWTKNGTEFDQE